MIPRLNLCLRVLPLSSLSLRVNETTNGLKQLRGIETKQISRSSSSDEQKPDFRFRIFPDDSLTRMNPPVFKLLQYVQSFPSGFKFREFINFADERYFFVSQSLYQRNFSDLQKIMDPKVLDEIAFRLDTLPDSLLDNLNFPKQYSSRFYPQITSFKPKRSGTEWEVTTCHVAKLPFIESTKRSRVDPSLIGELDEAHKVAHSRMDVQRMKKKMVEERIALFKIMANFRFLKEADKEWKITGLNYFY